MYQILCIDWKFKTPYFIAGPIFVITSPLSIQINFQRRASIYYLLALGFLTLLCLVQNQMCSNYLSKLHNSIDIRTRKFFRFFPWDGNFQWASFRDFNAQFLRINIWMNSPSDNQFAQFSSNYVDKKIDLPGGQCTQELPSRELSLKVWLVAQADRQSWIHRIQAKGAGK